MATRSYKRDSRGRFAGGGAAVTTTTGRAGGFANASVRANAANARAAKAQERAMAASPRQAAGRGRRRLTTQQKIKIGVGAAYTAAVVSQNRAVIGRSGFAVAVQAAQTVLRNSAAARAATSPLGRNRPTVKGETIRNRPFRTPALGR